MYKRQKLTLKGVRKLKAPDYSEKAPPFVVYTDAGEVAIGGVFMQEDNGTLQPIRFVSKVLHECQRHYAAIKKEVLAIKLVLEKLESYLAHTKFILRTDSRTAIGMIRNPNTVFDKAVFRWIMRIREFDFEIQHVNREDNELADALTRREEADNEDQLVVDEEELDEFHDKIAGLRVNSVSQSVEVEVPAQTRYSEKHNEIREFLITGKFPDKTKARQRKFIEHMATKYLLFEGKMYRKLETGSIAEVVDEEHRQTQIVDTIHEEGAHKGLRPTFELIKTRYYWEGQYLDVKRIVRSCHLCQAYSRKNVIEEYYSRPIKGVMQECSMDHLYLGGEVNKYLINLRCNFSGWIEAKAVPNTQAKWVVDFLKNEVLS